MTKHGHMTRDERLAMLKAQTIAIARDHRQHCDPMTCLISINTLGELLELAGIQLTQAEKEEFL